MTGDNRVDFAEAFARADSGTVQVSVLTDDEVLGVTLTLDEAREMAAEISKRLSEKP